ncbi:PEP-CTERM sorting domain-containing protein [Glaciecola sp. 1036]|uniref:PEP-CTERM sorting domain-containing protein n=1 Tax=Alteromonadaceae TaxID=72275 RepID=UPI003D08A545
MRFKLFSLSVLLAFTLSNNAQAGLISYHSATTITKSNCPEVDLDYLNENRQQIEEHFGYDTNAVGLVMACEYAAIMSGSNDTDYDKAIGGKYSRSSIRRNAYVESLLDDTELALPEIHMLAVAEENELIIGRTFAAQKYKWWGINQTLTFTADFDYLISETIHDNVQVSQYAWYEAAIAAITDLDVSSDPSEVYPISIDENLLLGGDYYHSQSSPNSGQERGDDGRISFEFDVTFGMEFYLFGRGSIMAFNGGFLDSSHTLTSSLTVSGATEEESEAIISNNLTLIKTVSVPAPSTLAIFLLGALGLAFRRFKK